MPQDPSLPNPSPPRAIAARLLAAGALVALALPVGILALQRLQRPPPRSSCANDLPTATDQTIVHELAPNQPAPAGWTTLDLDFQNDVSCFNLSRKVRVDPTTWEDGPPAFGLDHPRVGQRLRLALAPADWSYTVSWDHGQNKGASSRSAFPRESVGTVYHLVPEGHPTG
ncbi:MAG: hypothetical protein ACYCWW_00725 [Deltaproteobacteria bacterium]